MLTKMLIFFVAIAEHHRQQDEIRAVRHNMAMAQQDAETVRREANTLRMENTQLRSEISRLTGSSPQLPPSSSHHNPTTNGAEPYHNMPSFDRGTRPEAFGAPNGPTHGPESMSGVQYQNELPRINGTYQPQRSF
jgi:hypothetical protein